MSKSIQSSSNKPNPAFKEKKRNKSQDNVSWIANCIPENNKYPVLVLIGGRFIQDFRIRYAQSYLRNDLTPSSWSHVILLDDLINIKPETNIFEISLTPPKGFGFPPSHNGVQENSLSSYNSSSDFPNVGVLFLPVNKSEIDENIKRFKKQRPIIDSPELILRWLAYIWEVGNVSNPISESYGLPSATLMEAVVNSAGFELTPGLPSNSSCPEAIWQSFRWWNNYYKDQQKENSVKGFYIRSHIILDED
ncbi:MAG: hypothetical protein KDC73_06675 [Ignavibacteriae bacterium]|nr:hypothetical protein [Ignavibacteriota bacterium]MCB9243585.1 hypothetical protein [Ignavibacteriales bacterium]